MKKHYHNIIKEHIADCFFQILNEGTDYSSITISEIAKRSSIGRATFYRQFKGKEEIISYWLQTKTDLQKEITLRPEATGHDYYKLIGKIFQMFYDNQICMKAIVNCRLDYLLLDHINQFISVQLHEFFQFDDQLIVVAQAGALYNIALHWIKNDFRQSVKEVTNAYYMTIIKNFLRLISTPPQPDCIERCRFCFFRVTQDSFSAILSEQILK